MITEAFRQWYEQLPEEMKTSSDFTFDRMKAAFEAGAATARKEAFEEKWQPIESAPKGKTILGAYLNSHNKWRRVVMHYYGENEVENCGGGDEDYLAAGWYEMCESQDEVYRTEEEPIYWMPLPEPPNASKEGQN